MYDHVLIPVDGTDESNAAIPHGIALADRFDATAHALSVVVEGPYSLSDDEAKSEEQQAAEQAIQAVREAGEREAVPVETELRRGIPDEEILDYAESATVDIIVMATQRRTGLNRALEGSVTERVFRNSAIPVVTVPFEE